MYSHPPALKEHGVQARSFVDPAREPTSCEDQVARRAIHRLDSFEPEALRSRFG